MTPDRWTCAWCGEDSESHQHWLEEKAAEEGLWKVRHFCSDVHRYLHHNSFDTWGRPWHQLEWHQRLQRMARFVEDVAAGGQSPKVAWSWWCADRLGSQRCRDIGEAKRDGSRRSGALGSVARDASETDLIHRA